jgi:hypothetical protein
MKIKKGRIHERESWRRDFFNKENYLSIADVDVWWTSVEILLDTTGMIFNMLSDI